MCPCCCSYWGEALVGGMSHKKESAEECCAACRSYQPVKERDMMTCNGGRVKQPLFSFFYFLFD